VAVQQSLNDPMNASRILIFIPNWVGDVVMATAALSAIRRHFQTSRIIHVMRHYVGDVLAGAALADEMIFLPPGGLGRHWALIRQLRQIQFDLAILLTNSFRSALIARMAGASRRIGFARDARGWLLTDALKPRRAGNEYVPVPALDYYNQLARAAGCPNVGDQLTLATSADDEAAIDRRLGKSRHPLVVFNPGANYGSAKCWPAEKFAALADALTQRFGARVVASLGPKEGDIARRLRDASRSVDIFSDPPLGLGPLKALVRRCDLLVTNDTGPRHFAAAFGVPVVTVFGSSDPAWTETRFKSERSVMLHLDCQPCMERVCPLKHHNCMNQLEPELVLEKCVELLESRISLPQARQPV
jgi:heptosyltransferase-2